MEKIPTYYYGNDYAQFKSYFLSKNPAKKLFKKGEILWKSNELINEVYYIESGIFQSSVEHEKGYRKILSFHGPGTVFPGCHKSTFKIERSLLCIAVTDVEVLSFSRDNFYKMYQENMDLNAQVLEWYATYINLLIYCVAHQDYNSTLTKICNFLNIYLTYAPPGDTSKNTININQVMMSDILGINRVNIAKNLSRLRNEAVLITHRNSIEIIDYKKLLSYCTEESMEY